MGEAGKAGEIGEAGKAGEIGSTRLEICAIQSNTNSQKEGVSIYQ